MKLWMRAIPLSAVSVFLFMGIYIGVDTWQFRNNSEAGTAEIISLRGKTNSTSGSDSPSRDYISYYPTVRFATSQGMQYEMETTQALQKPIPDVGDSIPVRYYISENQGQVRLDYGAWWDWLIAGSITVVSLALFVITLIVTRREVPEI
jgi:hypothetical protein